MTMAMTELHEGDQVAERYTIRRLLGRGGMGSVYEVDDSTGEVKALKIIYRSSFASDTLFSEFVRRAKREADALALLAGHPNVVQVIDSGYLNETFWMVMECLKGVDLGKLPSSLLRTGALRVEVVIDWLLQACDGVGAAHQAGIVHRDLKPGNIFLCTSASIKVLDFGICKIVPTADAGEGTDISTILRTSTDFALSHGYAPLEQMRRPGQVDARADVFALGATLFRLLTGYYAYGADALTQISNMVTSTPPRALRDLRPDVTPQLERIVHRCLSLDPTARFADARELAASIRALGIVNNATAGDGVAKAGDPRPVTESPRRSRPHYVLATIWALVVGYILDFEHWHLLGNWHTLGYLILVGMALIAAKLAHLVGNSNSRP